MARTSLNPRVVSMNRQTLKARRALARAERLVKAAQARRPGPGFKLSAAMRLRHLVTEALRLSR